MSDPQHIPPSTSPSATRHHHGFLRSPSQAPVVFGSVGRSGLSDRLLEIEPVPIDELEVNEATAKSLAREEEELLKDCNVRTIQSTSGGYGALNDGTSNNGDEGDEDETASQEHTRLINKTWDDAVEHGQVHTSVLREIIYQTKASTTLVFTFLLQYSLPVASVFSVGHLGKVELGAVSLASMTASITGFALIEGMATCMDTLCAQAYGAKLYHQVGEHFQKCTLMILCYFVPISVLWWNASPLLAYFVEDKELVVYAEQYLRVVLAGIPGFVLFECGKRYLQAQGIFHASTVVLVICAPLNIALNYLLVWNKYVGFGFLGAPTAVAITSWLMAFMLFLYVIMFNGGKCWGGFSTRVFRNWDTMVRLAIPGVIMVEAEFMAFEILTLASAQFGTTALAAQTVCSSIVSIFYQAPFAVGIAASTRIGNFVGASMPSSARTATFVSLGIAVVIAFMGSCTLYYFRYAIGRAISSDEDVIKLVGKTIPAIVSSNFFDAICTVLSGILRGMGRQRIGGYLNLFFYYVVALPIAIYLAFYLDMQLTGLWLGINVALLCIGFSEIFYLAHCNWDAIVEEARARQDHAATA